MGTVSDELLEELSAAINFAYNETGHKDEMLSIRLNHDEGNVQLVGENAPVTLTPTEGGFIIKHEGREEAMTDKMKAAERSVDIFVDSEEM